ncbi:hypothetical protein D9M68_949000 [compost metagenome]
MSGQAVVAAGVFADGQFDDLDFLRAQAGFFQRAVQVQGGFQRYRAVAADRGVGVRHHADGAFDGAEQLGGVAGGFGDGDGVQTAHDGFL